MTKVAHPERETQNRIVTFFQKNWAMNIWAIWKSRRTTMFAGVTGRNFYMIRDSRLILLMQYKQSLPRFFRTFLNLLTHHRTFRCCGLSATPPHACKLARKPFSIFLTHL